MACGVSCRPRVALLENGASASSPTQETRQTRTWSKSRLRRQYALLPDSPLLGKLLGEPLELHGMNRMVFCKRINALSLCCAFLTAVVTPHCLGANKPTIAGEEIDQSVIAALPHQGATKPKVISHIDLTEPFGTVTQWTFVAVQEGGQPITEIEDHGPIHVCLVKASSPDCSENLYQQVGREQSSFDTPYHLLASSVVYAGQNQSSPLLFVQLCGAEGPNGNCGIATALYRYERGADRFIRVFQNLTGRNNNEATRLVGRGPLQGNMIVDYPTENAPFTYWIEVYRARESGQYVRVLRYRGRTGYGDGNPLAVADSEMPEILSHLGLWKPGDALPVPAHLPKGCSRLYMRQGEEWCK